MTRRTRKTSKQEKGITLIALIEIERGGKKKWLGGQERQVNKKKE